LRAAQRRSNLVISDRRERGNPEMKAMDSASEPALSVAERVRNDNLPNQT
jgi:hypothetical protein